MSRFGWRRGDSGHDLLRNQAAALGQPGLVRRVGQEDRPSRPSARWGARKRREDRMPAQWCWTGRAIPSLRMRNCSVERLIPRRAAAPSGPATTQWVARAPRGCGAGRRPRACPWRRRRAGPGASRGGVWHAVQPLDRHIEGRAGREDHGALDQVLQFADIARPVVLVRARIVSVGMVSISFFIRRANCWAKWRTSIGMSSRRSRSGGTLIGKRSADRTGPAGISARRPAPRGRGWWRRSGAHRCAASGCCPAARTRAPAERAAASVEVREESRRPRQETPFRGWPARSGRCAG